MCDTANARSLSWISRNAASIEAAPAFVTAMVAVAALIGVKFQLDEADRLQKAQSAREAYRAHLPLAANVTMTFQKADIRCRKAEWGAE